MAKNPYNRRWTSATLTKAMEEVKRGAPKRTVARKYGIPQSTLWDKLSGRRSMDEKRIKTYLTLEEEKEIVGYFQEMEARGFCSTKEVVLTAVKYMLDFKGRKTTWIDNKPTYRWWRNFMERHPEVVDLRRPLGKQCKVVSEVDIMGWLDADAMIQNDVEYTNTHEALSVVSSSTLGTCDQSSFEPASRKTHESQTDSASADQPLPQISRNTPGTSYQLPSALPTLSKACQPAANLGANPDGCGDGNTHQEPKPKVAKNPYNRRWTSASLMKAMEEVRRGGPLRKVARNYGIPQSTLWDKLTGRRSVEKKIKTYLTPEEEKEIVAYFQEMGARGFCSTKEMLVTAVKHMLDMKGRQTKWMDNKPARKWCRMFIKRHPEIGLRRPRGNQCKVVSESDIMEWLAADAMIQNALEFTINTRQPLALTSLGTLGTCDPSSGEPASRQRHRPASHAQPSSAPVASSPSPALPALSEVCQPPASNLNGSADNNTASTFSVTFQTNSHASADAHGPKDIASTLRKFALICSQIGENTLNVYYRRLEEGCDTPDNLYSLWKFCHDEIVSH